MAQIVPATCEEVPEHSIFVRFHANGSLSPDILCSYAREKFQRGVVCAARDGAFCYFSDMKWCKGQIEQ